MILVSKAYFRHLFVHKWITITGLFSLSLAVASVVAVHLVSEQIVASVDSVDETNPLAFTHLLSASLTEEQTYFDLRRNWRLGNWPNLKSMTPVLEGPTLHGARELLLIGFDPLSVTRDLKMADSLVRSSMSYGLLAESSLLAHPESGFELDDVINFDAGQARIAGYYDNQLLDRDTLLGDIAVVQQLLNKQGKLTAIGLVHQVPESLLWSALEMLFPGIGVVRPGDPSGFKLDGFKLDGFELLDLAHQDPTRQFAQSIVFNVGALSMLSVLVAGFIMHQGALSSLARRAQVFSRMQALGISQRETMVHVLIEALLLGIASVVVGLISGGLLSVYVIQAALQSQIVATHDL